MLEQSLVISVVRGVEKTICCHNQGPNRAEETTNHLRIINLSNIHHLNIVELISISQNTEKLAERSLWHCMFHINMVRKFFLQSLGL